MIHRKMIALAALALVTLAPLAAFAEPGFGPKGRGHGRGGGLFPPPGYLDLSEEQIQAVQELGDGVRAETEGIRGEMRALREQLRAALDGDAPDAASVGRMVIDLHGLRQSLGAIREQAETDFAALLTEEQLVKWENWKELRDSRRGPHRERFRGGPGFGDGPCPGGGPCGGYGGGPGFGGGAAGV